MQKAAAALAWFTLGVLAISGAAGAGFDSAPSLTLAAAATSAALMAWAFAGASLASEPYPTRLGWVPSHLSPAILLGLVFGMLTLSQLAEWVISLAGYQEVGNLPQFRHALRGATGAELAMAVVGIGFLPGFTEEIALRGFVQRGLQPRVGAVAAVGITSLLFGALHGEPVHAAGALALGLYLGTIVALCGSIRPAVLCHVVNNVVATLGAALPIAPLALAAAALGAVLGPWALWRMALQARAAHPPLGGSPEPDAPPSPLEAPLDPP
ncbi:MAG: CPBP family intramembrane metalloprotease [Deltaproteobacteria bacterium]|nr:CPBP family intramembrane metalloprotease [Deltaproteobacteria bacterium]MBW2445444.1 CPBP family intramembrane metalloprotease [Deltaproteobacteria bacterium]